MVFKEDFYFPARQSDDFVEAIENYGDGKYTVFYNKLSGYDNIMRMRPAIWTDEHNKEHWREEWLPVMCIYDLHKDTPSHYTYPDYWIRELDRTHVRNLKKKVGELIQDLIDHNKKLQGIQDAEYRKKQAFLYTKRWASNFCSVNVGNKSWETKQ